MKHNIEPIKYLIEPGYIYVSVQPAVISGVLGSCVAVCIWDRKQKIGGMNHFQYPVVLEKNKATAKYGNVATIALIRMMLAQGSKQKHLEAQIFGGAYNQEISEKNIGEENIRSAEKILLRENIHVVSSDTGGNRGRKVVFNTLTNEIAVMRVPKLRTGDWYPYENIRE